MRTVGDFNGDATGDLLLRNKVTGQNIGWLMNGTTVASLGVPADDRRHELGGRGVGDFDADGKADVIWRNNGDGPEHRLVDERLDRRVSAFLPTIADTNWEIQGVGDFDGDGKADVIWRNRVTGSEHRLVDERGES